MEKSRENGMMESWMIYGVMYEGWSYNLGYWSSNNFFNNHWLITHFSIKSIFIVRSVFNDSSISVWLNEAIRTFHNIANSRFSLWFLVASLFVIHLIMKVVFWWSIQWFWDNDFFNNGNRWISRENQSFWSEEAGQENNDS